MEATELEALVSAQRSAMLPDSPTSNTAASTETPTLKKAELIDLLCDRAALNAQEAREMVTAFFEVIGDALESGENVLLSGFGGFRLRGKPQRPGRNPKTGEAIPIRARRVVTFMQVRSSRRRLKPVANSVAVTDRKRPHFGPSTHHDLNGSSPRCNGPLCSRVGRQLDKAIVREMQVWAFAMVR
jgi:integration host factor subunit alpha